MTINEAKMLRNKHLKLIGTVSKLGKTIIDVIVEPLGVGERFRDPYFQLLRNFEVVSNDKLLQSFQVDSYQVSVILDFGNEMTKFLIDDVHNYTSMV